MRRLFTVPRKSLDYSRHGVVNLSGVECCFHDFHFFIPLFWSARVDFVYVSGVVGFRSILRIWMGWHLELSYFITIFDPTLK